MGEAPSPSRRPRVAVVMSVYNPDPAYLETQVESVLSQDEPCDLFIRDDGSPDNRALGYLEGLASSGRARFERGPNLGFTGSFLACLRWARDSGPYGYFAFCDQDDRWLPERVSVAAAALEAAGGPGAPVLHHSRYVFCDSSLNRVREEAEHPRGPSFQNALVDALIFGMVMTFTRALADEILKGDPNELAGHDWWAYLVATGIGTVVSGDEIVNEYRRHEENVTVSPLSFTSLFTYRVKNILFGKELIPVRAMHREFARRFGDRINEGDRKTLELFLPGHRFIKAFKKLFNPRPFRQNLGDEIGCRAMFLLGKL